MDKIISSPSRRQILLLLGLILVAKMGLEAVLIQSGYTTLLTDEYAHTWRAYSIVQNPHLFLQTDVRPPLPYIVLSGALALYLDLFWTPRVVMILFGLWSVVLMYQLTRSLFSIRAGLMAAILLAFFPWHVWLSATPLPEIFMITFQLGAAYQLVRFLRSENRRHLYGMCAYTALANSVHFHAWLFTVMLTLLILYAAWSGRLKGRLFTVTILMLLWLTPVAWLINLRSVYGAAFYFMQYKAAYDQSVNLLEGWPAVGFAFRALFNPSNFAPWFVPSFFGIAYAFRQCPAHTRSYLVLCSGLLFLILGLFFEGHYSWRHQRNLLPPVVLMLPFMAYWLDRLCEPAAGQTAHGFNTLRWNWGGLGLLVLLILCPTVVSYISHLPHIQNWSTKFRIFAAGYLITFLFTSVVMLCPEKVRMIYTQFSRVYPSFLSRLGWGVVLVVVVIGSVSSLRYFTYREREEAIRTGWAMRTLLEKTPKVEGKVLLEVTYWDSEAVRILSNAPERFVYDRTIQSLAPQNPSLLLELNQEEMERFVLESNIRLAVFRSTDLKQVLRGQVRAKELAHEGAYTIFALDIPHTKKSHALGNKRDG
jgi:4-amino-4-deoxy-L-arabinose transferase-like glycosyltransferase